MKQFDKIIFGRLAAWKHLFLTSTIYFIFCCPYPVSAQNTPYTNSNFLKKIGGATSANGAEIPAFDPVSKRVYVVAGAVVEYYSMSLTGALTLGGTLPTGFVLPASSLAIPNSVAISNGILAASFAVVNTFTNAQEPGRVTFYQAQTGAVLYSVTVGYLPDMVIFTPDGKKLLTANEGEPNSYNQATSFDPEGSVSIVDLSAGIVNATVQTASFTSFNSEINTLRAAGVRIYGPNATVAQDLEPEYIAISPDGTKAFVTLQENNALATIDIAAATVTSIKPLGLKDHSKPTVTGLQTFPFNNLPAIGTTAAGQTVSLGGFSGLTFEGYAPNGNLKFITHTDRGPNGEPTGINRPFFLPNFTPEIVRFELNRPTGNLTITQRLPLKKSATAMLTGLPNLTLGSNANLPYNDEIPVDLQGNVIANLDQMGADLEGIVVAPDKSFWMVDEYRPALYHFDANGVLIDRFVPAGTAAAAGKPAGTFGIEALPAVLGQRRQNRGFEAVAYDNGKIYAFVQSPLRNRASLSNAALNAMQNIRVIEFDPAAKKTTRQFLYSMDNPAPVSASDTRADKIGDAVSIGNGEFLVIERDDDAIDSDPLSQIQKKVYRFSLAGATDITSYTELINGKTVDQMTKAELQGAGIAPLTKYLHIDLAAAGYNTVEKVEGLTIIDRHTIAVVNDNDFGVAGALIDTETGTFTPDENAEETVLGLISLRGNGFDASDRDLNGIAGKINIQHWPVAGMYQPDAIAAFTVGGQTYYITANEGDARDWPGFSEEVRVGNSGYVLDPVVFPNASVLKQNINLGRLQLTNATGKLNNDNTFDQIHALGARSFSIRDAAGNLVYDSGDELEQITATFAPTLFNSEGTAAGFDSRSDNKGPEPEGVATGVINGITYAFVGLERTGDIVVYELSDPANPQFVQYINTPEDRGVEGLIFVPAENSPTGKPLVITTAELSSTVSVYEVDIASITTWYRDRDGDGFGDPKNTMTSIAKPEGYVSNNLDCNDYRLHYEDKDNDGWGSDVKIPCGLISRTGDCNDNDPKIHSQQTFYRDADGDSYGDAANKIMLCTNTPPQGYVRNSIDCNDNDKGVYWPKAYYRDADGDGLGDPTSKIASCTSTPPAGYVSNSRDTDDTPFMPTVQPSYTRLPTDGKLTSETEASAFALSAYPNPLAGETQVRYTVPVEARISIRLYDALGQQVGTVFDGVRTAGTYTQVYNTGKLSQGVYFCRMIAVASGKEYVQTQKLVKAR
jgi:hypothetical protein